MAITQSLFGEAFATGGGTVGDIPGDLEQVVMVGKRQRFWRLLQHRIQWVSLSRPPSGSLKIALAASANSVAVL